MADVPTVQLNNGTTMPQFGLGVWQASDHETEEAVGWALDAGYRLIDTAAAYGNEAGVGRAIRNSGLKREDIFVTTKLWNADQGHDRARAAFDTSLNKLGLEYVDLYLIHWPMPAIDKYIETWQALEEIYASGRAKAIGVSNFQPEHLEKLLANTQLIPAVNQIELHPYLQQTDTRALCAQNHIAVESWSPIARAGALLENSVITDIATAHSKTPAQVVLRWHIQSGLIVIPKSVHRERIAKNIAIFDFTLTEDEMAAFDELDRGERIGPDPATANFH